MAYYGMYGFLNPYYQLGRLNNSASADEYDPYLSSSGGMGMFSSPEMLQYQQSMLRGQLNAFNPNLALGQNLGAALGNGIGRLFGGGQAPAPGPQEPAEAMEVRDAIHSAITSNLQNDPDMGKATYDAAMSVLRDPRYSKDPIAQRLAMRFAQDAVERYKFNPNEQKDASLVRAQQQLALDQGNAKLAEERTKSRWQVYDAGSDDSGKPAMTSYGEAIPMYGEDGKIDPDFNQKIQQAYAAARQQGFKNPQVMKEDDYINSKQLLEQQKEQAAAQLKANQDAQLDPFQVLSKEDQDAVVAMLKNKTMTPQDIGTGRAAAGRLHAMAQAYRESQGQYNPNDAVAVRQAQKSWMGNGQNAKNMSALNKALYHTHDVDELIDAMQNTPNMGVNAIKQYWNRSFAGSPAPTNLSTAGQILSDELNKYLLQVNAGSERERQELAQKFSNAGGSPEQLHEAVATARKMMLDAALTSKAQYTRDTGGKLDFNQTQLLTPLARKEFEQYEYSKYQKGSNVITSQQDYDKLPYGTPYEDASGKVKIKQAK